LLFEAACLEQIVVQDRHHPAAVIEDMARCLWVQSLE
jgi:hypothetical protein